MARGPATRRPITMAKTRERGVKRHDLVVVVGVRTSGAYDLCALARGLRRFGRDARGRLAGRVSEGPASVDE